MRFYITNLFQEEIDKLREEGKFVYHLRGYDDPSEGGSFFATIEPRVWVNNVGQIVTSEEIEFKDGYVDYDKFAEENEEVEEVDLV